ncbi:MAG: hypothetical protein ABSA51_03580 [Anaerolineaceae bacterium]|jgi:hypothetical protein
MYNNDLRPRVHVRNPVGTFLVAIGMALIVGFAIGYFLTNLVPAISTVTAPLVCTNGTMQTQRTTTSQSAGEVTVHFTAYCNNNGTQTNVTNQLTTTNGAIFAVLTAILVIIVLLIYSLFSD